jgi:hypothetical protein
MDTKPSSKKQSSDKGLFGAKPADVKGYALDLLPEVILENTIAYCEPKDAIQLRATCKKLEKKANDHLISTSLDYFKQENCHEDGEIFEAADPMGDDCNDRCFFIAICRGKSSYKNKQKTINSALKNALMDEYDVEIWRNIWAFGLQTMRNARGSVA